MASIQKRGDRYCARVRIGSLSKSKTFRTLAEARQWAKGIEAKAVMDGGTLGIHAHKDKTLGDLFKAYLDHLESRQRKDKKSTHVSARYFLRRWLASKPSAKFAGSIIYSLRSKKLVNLDTADFALFRDERRKQVASSCATMELAAISGAYRIAIKEWGWLRENPLTSLDTSFESNPRTRRVEQHEIDTVLKYCEYSEDKPIPHDEALYGALFLTAIETAARGIELSKLTWPDVSLNKRSLFFHDTKNGSDRIVPLSLRAVRILKQVKTYQRNKGRERVFAPFGVEGYGARPERSMYAINRFQRVLRKKTGIEGLNFHDTRREGLTRMSQKVNVMTLAKISGHKDLRVLQEVYYAPNITEVASLLD